MMRRRLPAITITLGSALIAAAVVLALLPSSNPVEQAFAICTPADFAVPEGPGPVGQRRADAFLAAQREGRLSLCPTITRVLTPAPGAKPVPTMFRIVAGDGVIMIDGPPPFSSISYLFSNHWASSSEPGRIVFAGRLGTDIDPTQGVLLIGDLDNYPGFFAGIRPLAKTGSLEIAGARGRVLQIEAEDGSRFLFDVDSLTLTDIDGLAVPTQSPYPTR